MKAYLEEIEVVPDEKSLGNPDPGASYAPCWARTKSGDGMLRGPRWLCDLAAVAPDMVRVLLDMCWTRCRYCEHDVHVTPSHRPGCSLDAALTKAGFPDQASRDEARAEIAATK